MSISYSQLVVRTTAGFVAGATIIGATAVSADEPAEAVNEVEAIIELANTAGFATGDGELSEVDPVVELAMADLEFTLPADGDGVAHQVGDLVVNGEFNDADDQMISTDASFAVVTDQHDELEYRFAVELGDGMTLAKNSQGDLLYTDVSSGEVLGVIGAATAIDEAGGSHPADYSYDPVTSEIVLTADTTDAIGSVLIDPSWRCWWILGKFGLAFLGGVIAWYTGNYWLVYRLLQWVGRASHAVTWQIYAHCR